MRILRFFFFFIIIIIIISIMIIIIIIIIIMIRVEKTATKKPAVKQTMVCVFADDSI